MNSSVPIFGRERGRFVSAFCQRVRPVCLLLLFLTAGIWLPEDVFSYPEEGPARRSTWVQVPYRFVSVVVHYTESPASCYGELLIEFEKPAGNPALASITGTVTDDFGRTSNYNAAVWHEDWTYDHQTLHAPAGKAWSYVNHGYYSYWRNGECGEVQSRLASDQLWWSSHASLTVQITASRQPPTAAFTWKASSEDEKQIEFDASGSTDPDNAIDSYDWDFGDGTTGSGQHLIHTYEQVKSYLVGLTVTDAGGLTGTIRQKVTIGKAELAYALSVAPDTARPGDTVFVSLTLENTGTLPLSDVHGTGELKTQGTDGGSAGRIDGPEPAAFGALEPDSSGIIRWRYRAESSGRVEFTIQGVTGKTPDQDDVTGSFTCPKAGLDPGKNPGTDCPAILMVVQPALAVNSVEDRDDDDPEDGVCDTGQTIDREGKEEAECTLRAALTEALQGRGTRVTFNIPGTIEEYVIQPASALPELNVPVVIDGTSQPGYRRLPVVRIDGSGAGSSSGLIVTGPDVSLLGLAVTGFSGDGVVVRGAGATGTAIHSSLFGTNLQGSALGNLGDGIRIENGASGFSLGDLSIVGSGGCGIHLRDIGAGSVAGKNVASGMFGSIARCMFGYLTRTDSTLKLLPQTGSHICGENVAGVEVLQTHMGPSARHGIEFTGGDTRAVRFIETVIGNLGVPEPLKHLIAAPSLSGIYLNGVSEVEIGGSETNPTQIVGVGGSAVEVTDARMVRMMHLMTGMIKQNVLGSMVEKMRVGQTGIRVENSQDVSIDHATVTNGRTGIDLSGSGSSLLKVIDSVIGSNREGARGLGNSIGISLTDVPEALLAGNTLTSNLTAILAIHSTIDVQRNSIVRNLGSNSGIHLEDAHGTIVGNIIDRDEGDAIFLDAGSDPSIHLNQLAGNAGFAIRNLDPSVIIDARQNWWGDASGPSGEGPGAGDEVSAHVDYSGWLENPSLLVVEAGPEIIPGRPGAPGSFPVTIQNHLVPDDTLTVTVADDKGWVTSPGAVRLVQSGGNAVRLFVMYQTPTGSDKIDRLTVRAVSAAIPGIEGMDSVTLQLADVVDTLTVQPDQTGFLADRTGFRMRIEDNSLVQPVTLHVFRTDDIPTENTFGPGLASTGDGVSMAPSDLAPVFWTVQTEDSTTGEQAMGKSVHEGLTCELCLQIPEVLLHKADRLMVLKRDRVGVEWNVNDTHTEWVGATRYVCASGLTPYGEFTVSVGTTRVPSAPLPAWPDPGSTGSSCHPFLAWNAIMGCMHYTIQLASDPSFTAIVDSATVADTTFQVTGLSLRSRYYWRIRAKNAFGDGPWSAPFQFMTTATGIEQENVTEVPSVLVLDASYPNPFDRQTTIRFHLPAAAPVSVVIYDLLGRRVRSILAEDLPGGHYSVVWDGVGEDGQRVASGVYLYRLMAGRHTRCRTLVFVK